MITFPEVYQRICIPISSLNQLLAKRVALLIFVEANVFQPCLCFRITWKLLKISCPQPRPQPQNFREWAPGTICFTELPRWSQCDAKVEITTLDPCCYTLRVGARARPAQCTDQPWMREGHLSETGILLGRGAHMRDGTRLRTGARWPSYRHGFLICK